MNFSRLTRFAVAAVVIALLGACAAVPTAATSPAHRAVAAHAAFDEALLHNPAPRYLASTSPMAPLATGVTACVAGTGVTAPVATLTFTAPTTNVDGTPVITPLTYNLYEGTTSGAETSAATKLTGSPINVTTGLKSATTYYFEVTAVDANGNESARSNEACKAFPAASPNSITITIQ